MTTINFRKAGADAGNISRRRMIHTAFKAGMGAAVLSMGRSAFAQSGDTLVGFSFPDFEHFRWPFDRKFFEKRAGELGLRSIIQGAQQKSEIQEQQIEAMLSQNIKALVINPINNASAVGLIERIKAEKNIPIISYNSVITSPKIDFWTARDNYQVGELQAKKALADHPSGGNWAVVSGPQGLDIAQQKTEGAMRVLKPHIESGAIKIVSHQYHDAWSPQGALNQIENALTRNRNKLDVVIANEDGMALGALQALKEQGLDGKTWLCGEDVFPEVAREIKSGKVSASAWTDLIAMGAAAADASYALARGDVPKSNDSVTIAGRKIPGMRIQSQLVTIENLREFVTRTGWLKPSDIGL